MADPLGRIRTRRLTGAESLRGSPGNAASVLGFWQWSGSDLMDNTSRGVLAEYLVALALNVDVSGTREGWTAWDLETPEHIRIQVKSAGFLQSWHQKQMSTIVFNVEPKRAWDADSNTSTSEPCRHSDVHVFALLAHQDKATVDPLDVSQWRFFVLPTKALDERTRRQHSISLKSLQALTGHELRAEELRSAVLKAAERPAV